MIQVNNISRSFFVGGDNSSTITTILDNVSLEIKDGDFLAIVGKSGSGKSTLMHCISGLDTPQSGEVMYDGVNIFGMSSNDIANFRNKKIGFVFQFFYLQEKSTCFENCVLPLEIEGEKIKSERISIVTDALKRVGMYDKANSIVQNLSGGQKQRIAIARAIVNSPEYIFADEPTGNLDTLNSNNILNILLQLNKDMKKTIVIVTHDLEIAKKAKRSIQIVDGKIHEN